MLLATLPVYVIALGMGFGCAQPARMALLVDRVRGEERGLAVSTYFMGFDIGVGLGAIALGFVSQAFDWESDVADLRRLRPPRPAGPDRTQR